MALGVVVMPATRRRSPACGLVALTLGLLALDPTLTVSHAELLQCEESFYRHTPPHSVAESGLEKRCHLLSEGRSFASLFHPACHSDIYAALRLNRQNRWGRGAKGEKDESSSGKEDIRDVFVPSLLKNDQNSALSGSVSSPRQKLDTLTTELVESRAIPLCSEAGGDVYVQSGVGRLSDCESGLLWSAVCCAVPNGGASFNMGAVQEGEGQLKVMSVAELEKLVEIDELFSGGCGEGTNLGGWEATTLSKETHDSIKTTKKERHTTERSEDGAETTDAVSEAESEKSESSNEKSETSKSETSESESSSVLFNVLSTSLSLLYAPVSPVVSTLTDLPSQIGYVLQEDAAVLAELPGNSITLVQNLGSGAISGVENVGSVLYQVGETTVGSLYSCLSTLASTLWLSCNEGVAGTGTLMGNVLGLVTGVLGQGLELGTEMVESTGQQLLDYFGTVGSELGQQARTVTGGVGTLVWRGQRGVMNVLSMVGAILGGVVENTVENVQEAFGRE